MLDRDIEDTREPEWEEYDDEPQNFICDICDLEYDVEELHSAGDLNLCDDCFNEMVGR